MSLPAAICNLSERPDHSAEADRLPCCALPAGPGHRLLLATLDLFAASDDPVRDRHGLLEPLRDVVLRHKTRRAQLLCARFARALVAGNDTRALAACRELIALESVARA